MSRLLWHRRDLRISDNELYSIGANKIIHSLFIFDPSDYSPRPTGIVDDASVSGHHLQNVTHGPHFTRVLLDAVHSLRRNLQSLGGNLIVRHGDPLDIIPKLARELKVEEVAWSEIPGYYECSQSEQLKKYLLRDGEYYRCKVYTTCSLTLAHPNDLPKDRDTWQRLARPKEKRKKRKPKQDGNNAIPMETIIDVSDECPCNVTNVSPSRFVGMPAIMGDFRRVARTSAPIRELFEEPKPHHIAKDLSGLDMGEIPTLEELTQPLLDTSLPILGCLPKELVHQLVQSAREIPHSHNINVEEQSIRHIHDFVEHHAASANRSMCDVSNNGSSRLSTPLALGTLSPHQVYHCAKQRQSKLETLSDTNPADINWLISHIEMRDFFLFESFQNGRSAYQLHPTKQPAHKPNNPREWLPLSQNRDKILQWASGQTNLPMVDAGMKELLTTGYTSNRVRQNMASVLTKDLKLDWRLGAEFFQLCLEDHCVAANFGNWAYFAGVGGDPKNRHFRTVSQAWRYDSDGRYVRKWIDRLRDCGEGDVEEVLRPWDFQNDWGATIVPPVTQLTWQDRERLESTGRISTE